MCRTVTDICVYVQFYSLILKSYNTNWVHNYRRQEFANKYSVAAMRGGKHV